MNDLPDNPRDETLLAAARAELEQGAQALDPATLARLRAARHQALTAPQSAVPPRWLPAAALATIVAVIVGVWMQKPTASSNGATEWMSTLDDTYDLYENLEFYEWLEAQPDEKTA